MTLCVVHHQGRCRTLGFGLHPLGCWCDNTGEPLAGMLRPGSAGSNTTAGHLEVLEAPSFVVSHNLPLDRAPQGYQHFDARDSGWTKVVLAAA